MRLGAVFPTTEIGDDPIAVRDYAQAAEALGCVRLTAYDHVLGVDHADRDPALRGPYTQHDPFHEPFVLFGFLAAHTTRIELATGVLVLPQRQTALVAKQAAEVDAAVGRTPRARRRHRVEPRRVHVARHHVRRPRPPARRPGRGAAVAVGGRPRRPHQRVPPDRASRSGAPAGPAHPAVDGRIGRGRARCGAARVGDGHIFAGNTDRHFAAAGRLVELLAEHGRDRATFGMDMFVDFASGPDVWHDRAQRWERFGGSLMSMRSMTTGTSFLGVPAAGLTGPAEHIAALERFVTEMAPG